MCKGGFGNRDKDTVEGVEDVEDELLIAIGELATDGVEVGAVVLNLFDGRDMIICLANERYNDGFYRPVLHHD